MTQSTVVRGWSGNEGLYGDFMVIIHQMFHQQPQEVPPLLAPYAPLDISGVNRLKAPTVAHLMGTDEQGRDVLSRLIFGARVSLYVACGAVVITLVVGGAVGILSGYMRGATDAVIQRFVDGVMSFPWLVLLLTLMMLFGNTLTNVAVVIGLISGIRTSRIVRSTVMSLRENQYIEAARALGGNALYIMMVHVLPNTFAPLMVIATLTWGNTILVESSLSFLGFGVPPPEPSWGRAVSEAGRFYLESAPWVSVFPGIAISLSVFAFNMLGDALRDHLDPRQRRQ